MNTTSADEVKKAGRPTRFAGKDKKLGVTVTTEAFDAVHDTAKEMECTASDATELLIRKGRHEVLRRRQQESKRQNNRKRPKDHNGS